MPPPPDHEAATVAAPDGGWGWLVLVGGFVIYFVNDGIENSFGLLAAEIIRQMGTSRQSIGWIVSLKFACMCFVCPLAAILCQKVDVRIVGSIAGFLSFLGFFIASFTSKPWHLFLTIGLVTGPGVGTCFFITLVTICLYFNKLRATAAGIALCGSGLGGLTLNPLLSHLTRLYGWQGSLLLLSGLYLNTIPCCLLFRPLESLKPMQQLLPEEQQMAVASAASDSDASAASAASAAAAASAISSRNSELRLLQRRESTDESIRSGSVRNDGDPTAAASCARSGANRQAAVDAGPLVADTHNTTAEATAAAAVVTTAGADQGQRLHVTAWLAGLFLMPIPWSSSPKLPESAGNNEVTSPAAAATRVSAALHRCRRRCRNPRLLAFQASRILLAAAAPTIYAYTADRGLQQGLTEGQAAALMSILSACSMVGRLGFGCLGDTGLLPPLAIYGLALVFGGCLVAASLTAGEFGALAGFMGAACFFSGGAFSLTTLVTVHLDGTHRLCYVFARQSIFQGIGVLIGPPLAGAIYDGTGSYSATFAFVSASLTASGLVVLVIHLTSRETSSSSCSSCMRSEE